MWDKDLGNKCFFCGKAIKGYGNNAFPFAPENAERCCSECNNSFVAMARVLSIHPEDKRSLDRIKQVMYDVVIAPKYQNGTRMYTVGIVGRAYKNKDDQSIIQTHEAVRRFLADKKNIVCITILPTEDQDYVDMEQGSDNVDTTKLDFILKKCDAFIVPGGSYGYKFDEYVIRHAINEDKPLLAICLGFQIMCSMFAKNRTKFDMTKPLGNDSHMGKATEYKHIVNLQLDTKLRKIINQSIVKVNSCHHDIVNFEMSSLIVNAISEDGVIEGVEYPESKFIFGVQWHPEYIKDSTTQALMNSFIESIIR